MNSSRFSDLDLEYAALSFCITNEKEGFILFSMLQEGNFTTEITRYFYHVLKNMVKTHDTLSADLFEEETLNRGDSKASPEQVANLIYRGCPYDVEFVVARLKKITHLNQIYSSVQTLSKELEGSDLEHVLEELPAHFDAFMQTITHQDKATSLFFQTHFKDDRIYKKIFERKKMVDQGEHPFQGHPFGFVDIDKIIPGMNEGHLIIIGARPSVGKTSLALNVILNNPRLKTALFSMEMSNDELMEKFVCMEGRIDSRSVKKGTMTTAMLHRVYGAQKTLEKFDLFVDEEGQLSPFDILSRCKRAKIGMDGLDLVVIDYIGLMKGPSKTYESNQVKVADISRSLKHTAKILKCPIIVLAQLNRELEKGQLKPRAPRLSDLRESGAIEADADTVLLLNPSEAFPNVLEVIIAKNRFGARDCMVKLAWEKENGRMSNCYLDSPERVETPPQSDAFQPFTPSW